MTRRTVVTAPLNVLAAATMLDNLPPSAAGPPRPLTVGCFVFERWLGPLHPEMIIDEFPDGRVKLCGTRMAPPREIERAELGWYEIKGRNEILWDSEFIFDEEYPVSFADLEALGMVFRGDVIISRTL